MSTSTSTLPMILEEVEVTGVDRLSPSFVRIELGSAGLAEIGPDGPLLDQRIKLIFPGASGQLPDFTGADESWYAAWMALPEAERGSMRTYTIRAVRGRGADTRIVVDIVLHPGAGEHGPGADWAEAARVGDRVVLVAPRVGHDFGGIEFDPGEATEVLLVGDETAVPAVAGILRDLPADASGAAYLEVPVVQDFLDDVVPPTGVKLTWIARDGAAVGQRLHAAVAAHLGVGAELPDADDVTEADVDPELWETPTYSSSGEALPESGRPHAGLYAWIAGESGMVTGLRRHLVRELGVDRSQVAFMGYWRQGVAMRG